MKKRWLFVLVAAVILLAIPAGSLAAGNVHDGVLLEGEESPEVTPTPTEVPTTSEPELTPTLLTPTPTIEPTSTSPLPTTTPTLTPTLIPTPTPDSSQNIITLKCSISNRTIPIGTYFSIDAYISSGARYNGYMYDNDILDLYYVKWYNDHHVTVYVRSIMAGTGQIGIFALIEADLKSEYAKLYFTVTDEVISASPIPSDTTNPSSSAHTYTPITTITPTAVPTHGAGGEGYSGPKPTRVPKEMVASDWDEAEDEILGMEPGSLGRIELPDDPFVPASLLKTLIDTQCALEINMGGYLCVIDGAELTEIPDGLYNVDIGMTMEKDAAVSAACGGSAFVLRFSYRGELPGTFTFRVPAQGSRPGDTVYLYYLDEETGAFEGVHAAVVDDEGYASLNITHCSSYYMTDTIIEGAKNNFELPAEAPEAQRSGFAAFIQKNYIAFWIGVYILGCGVIAAVVFVIFRRRNKRKAEPGQHASVRHTYMK